MKEMVWSSLGKNSVQKLKKLADEKEISLSEYIRQLILVELEQKGGRIET
jgi:hypothetical protein